MKIVHLCLSNFYIESFGYQENIIPKYHKKDGHDVTIIASRFIYHKENGQPRFVDAGKYVNSDGIKVIRINYKYMCLGKLNEKLKIYKDTFRILRKEKPDLIFSHGMQYLDLLEVARYIKANPSCRLVVDSHAASINSGRNILSRQILHKLIYKNVIHKSLPFIDKVFVIAKGCKEFAKEMYDIPDNKMEYLYLGADTEKINFSNKNKIFSRIREKLGIDKNDFVLITGGKINKEKNLEFLLNAIKKISSNRLKLIVFGAFSDDIRDKMLKLIEEDNRIYYIGWLNGEDVYDYYLASDVAIFPGTKSALWEQAICSGLPLICRLWDGMEHVDVGGNCIFIDGKNEYELIKNIILLMENEDLYNKMKQVAETKGFQTFSYATISKQALD